MPAGLSGVSTPFYVQVDFAFVSIVNTKPAKSSYQKTKTSILPTILFVTEVSCVMKDKLCE